MNRLKYSFCICFLLTAIGTAQTKTITLEAIWDGVFRTEGIDVLHSMANGEQYSVLNFDRISRSTSIDIYDYKTLQKTETLVSSRNLKNMSYFSDYTFSDDEQKLILATNVKSIYRHSKKGEYYLYKVKEKSLSLIFERDIQEPTFSPDGNKVAFVFENNLYIKDLNTAIITQVTYDGEKNKIINGVTDWVYEEEFSFVRAFDWNTESNKIAFIKFDETLVPEFSMDVFGETLYPTQEVFKYPKAGEANALVSLHVYDLETENTTEVEVGKKYQDHYIPRIKWTHDPHILSAQYINRHQNILDLWLVNTETNVSHVALVETDKAYVEVTDNLTFLKDNSFIWTSEKDGYNHIYHYDKQGKLIRQVTKGKWEVTDFYGYDEKNQTIFYQSVENGSINRDVYAIKINGRHKTRLTKQDGTNQAEFSSNFAYFINTFSNATTPPEYTLNNAATGSVLKRISGNDALLRRLSEYQISEKEFGTLHVNGHDLNMWIMKPADFDPSKKYPLFMTQYSGPGSQSVSNSWNNTNDYWYQHLAQQGYIVACVDGRGTGYKGAEFKKATYLNLVKYETIDQIAAAKALGERSYVNADAIGIWGWSFGGHMATNCLLKGNDVFKMAIAVAPVTSWRFYDTIYTERYMRTPQENPKGYDDNSPLEYPELLKGNYLLLHGSADDNVHVQHTMRMVEALIQADKQFDWGIYPDKNHGIYGGNTRLHLYKKMTNFIKKNL
ncbi:S9 family peptidase [Mariniflexile ostreae]|uniref:S9 family peptidase n=1 Tax=Mariniflexile ostreae TaxID=1520892 RepID=A0ABV5FC13_9FLAO